MSKGGETAHLFNPVSRQRVRWVYREIKRLHPMLKENWYMAEDVLQQYATRCNIKSFHEFEVVFGEPSHTQFKVMKSPWSTSWTGRRLILVPTPMDILPTLRKLCIDIPREVILVIPAWKNQQWYKDLCVFYDTVKQDWYEVDSKRHDLFLVGDQPMGLLKWNCWLL